MTMDEAIELVLPAMIGYGAGRYRFACRNGILLIRLLNMRKPRRFSAADRVCFRLDDGGIAVEDMKTGAVRLCFLWNTIETLAAGEPETSSGDLFQG